MAKALGDSVIVEPPKVERKSAQHTIGIRERIPSKTIAGAIPKFLARTKAALAKSGVEVPGKPFFRFHGIKMGLEYDLEVGYLSPSKPKPVEGTVVNSFPAGKYVTLKYAGKNRGYQGSKALIEWARSEGHELDCRDTDSGDTFACRFEVYLSDIDKEPDHRKWIKEVAIKIK
jgi:hypothetical protein